jgi:hypothetical protein
VVDQFLLIKTEFLAGLVKDIVLWNSKQAQGINMPTLLYNSIEQQRLSSQPVTTKVSIYAEFLKLRNNVIQMMHPLLPKLRKSQQSWKRRSKKSPPPTIITFLSQLFSFTKI